ncbi:MAG: CopD family protein [Nitrosopumilaceae archaeon]|nr:CopD family protein [Nitrosopumilaceae archaeon]
MFVLTIEHAIITWIHLVTASIWLGGSVFIGLVIAPTLKGTFSLQERIKIMIKIGKQFNKLALPSLVILIVTGIYKAHLFLTQPDILFTTNYGYFLLIKIILVIVLILSFIIHVKIINQDLIISNQNEKQFQKLRSKIIFLGKLTLIISLLIFLMAALLDDGV